VSFDPPQSAVQAAVALALSEDLGESGDVSAALVPDREARALIVSREAGVLAGEASVTETFRQVDDSLRLDWMLHDGDPLAAGQKVATIGGRIGSILTGERTALNFLGHLSGVASLTRRYVDAAAAAGSARVLDTRKTLPGLRQLQKAAVRAGGGSNHRMSLSDMVMLKDNHLAAIGIFGTVARSRELWPTLRVEVECDNPEQVVEAVDAGADVVMLDNMTPDEVGWCVAKVGGRCEVEVSGGVTLETIADYSAAGPDFISIGRLTHSAPQLDLSLEIRVAPLEED